MSPAPCSIYQDSSATFFSFFFLFIFWLTSDPLQSHPLIKKNKTHFSCVTMQTGARGLTPLSHVQRLLGQPPQHSWRQLQYVWLTCGKVVRLCKSLCNLHQQTCITSPLPSGCVSASSVAASRLQCTSWLWMEMSSQHMQWFILGRISWKKNWAWENVQCGIYEISCDCSEPQWHSPCVHGRDT